MLYLFLKIIHFNAMLSRLPINKFQHWTKFDFFSAVIHETGACVFPFFPFPGREGQRPRTKALVYPLRPTLLVIYFKNNSKMPLDLALTFDRVQQRPDWKATSHDWWLMEYEWSPKSNAQQIWCRGSLEAKNNQKKKFRNWFFFSWIFVWILRFSITFLKILIYIIGAKLLRLDDRMEGGGEGHHGWCPFTMSGICRNR